MRKMDSEGPYTKTSTWLPSCVDGMITAPTGSSFRVNNTTDAAREITLAFREGVRLGESLGRKSAEKDFQELLELAEALRGDIDFISTSTMDFDAWKKARGIG